MARTLILMAWSTMVLGAIVSEAQSPASSPPSRGALVSKETPQILPMRYYGTRPAVEVRVNGSGPFLFLIDTGAAGAPARADVTLVRSLGLQQVGTASTADAGGAGATIDRVMLERVDVGGLTATGVEALSRDYNTADYLVKIDGILGLNLFRDLLLTMDFGASQVRLERGELPPADGRTILDYELVNGNPAITVQIGSRPMQVLLDSGNVRALDMPTEWVRTLDLASFPRVVGNSSSVSGTVGLREVTLAEPLIIGQYRLANPAVTFANEYQEANLGSTVLRAFSVTIDQKNQRVRFIQIRGRHPFPSFP